MGAIGIIAHYSKLKDVSFERTDGSPVEDLDSPIFYTSASRLYMGPVSGGGGGGGSFSLGVSTGGNTLGQTGVTGTRVVLAGEGAITLSQVTGPAGASLTLSAPPQSVQTQGRFNLTLAGNTSGALQEVSSGTLTLAGGPNITVSQNGNAITISGVGSGTGAQSVQTLGLYADGNTTGQSSSTTRDARSVSLRGDGAVSVGFSGGSIRISAPTQSVQPETQTFVGGVAASNTTYTSGTVTLVGSGDITVLSGTGQRVIISGSQSVQPETQTFLGGISASDTLYTSGTVRITGVGGGVTVSSNTGQRIDISVAAPVAQSVQTQNVHNVTLSGNTAGVLAEISSGTMTLAGGNNITVSQNGNAVTISGPNVGGAQTGISGLANSQTTYTSGTVSLSELGAITIRSTTGNQFQLSVNPQSVQPETQTFVGGIAGSDTTYTSGTVRITGVGGGITVSSNTGQRIDLSVAAQSVQPGIQNLVASNTTFSSGTVSISGFGAATVNTAANIIRISVPVQTAESQSIGMSNIGNTSGTTGIASGAQVRMLFAGGNNVTLSQSLNGASGTITISAANQTVQTQNVVDVTLSGNTAGVQALISSGTMTLAGGNNITVSQNGNAVTISGPNVGGAQTGISGIIASDATYTSGTVEITGSGIVTIRSSAGQRVVVDASQSAQTAGLYALGNTVGESSSTTRDARSISIRGDGIVSVGYSNGSLRISASQSVQPETQTFLGGLIASDKTYTSGTITLSGVGGGITVQSNAGQRIDLSVAAPVAQTDQTLGLYAVQNTTGQSSSTTRDARSISVAGDGAVSVGYSAGSLRISAPTQSVQPGIQNLVASDATFSSGTVSISGFGDVTVNTAANLIRISAPVQTAESQSFGMSNIGNTSGTTGIASGAQMRFLLAGGNGITLSQSLNGASGTITISGITQSVESQSFGMSNVGNTSGTTGMASGGQVRLVLAGGNNITLSQSLNGASGTITISAPNAVAQTNQTLGMYAVQNTTGQSSSTTMDARTLSIAGDGAVSVGYSAGSLRISAPTQTGTQFSAGISGGNTAGDTGTVAGRLVLAGGANITLSGSTNGVSETVSIVGGGGGGFSAGASNLGNTAGDTGVTGTRLVLVGTNNITLSQTTGAAGATISISGAGGGAGQFSAGVSTGGNTAGATGLTGTQLVLVGTNAISLSQTTGANGGTVSIDAPATSSLVGASGVSISTNGSTISVYHPARTQFYPFNDIPIVTGQQGQATLHIAPLHFPNVQHDRLLLGMQISNATNSSNSITISAWAGIYSRNASSISLISSISTSTNFTGSGTVGSYSLYGGPKWLTIPWTNTITEDDYWFGIVIRTTTGGGAGHTVSQLCVSKFTNSAWSGLLGAGSNATDQYQLGLGVYSASTSGMPASIAFTQIQGSGSMALREPIFHLRSGTV